MYISHWFAECLLANSYIGNATNPTGSPQPFRYPAIGPVVSPQPYAVGLCTAARTIDQMRANNYDEFVHFSYLRQSLTWPTTNLASPTRVIALSGNAQFNKAAADDWGTVRYVGIFNNATKGTGNLLWFVEVNPTINMTAGAGHVDNLLFPATTGILISHPTTGTGAPTPSWGKRWATAMLGATLAYPGGAGSSYYNSTWWGENADPDGEPSAMPLPAGTKTIAVHLVTNYTDANDTSATGALTEPTTWVNYNPNRLLGNYIADPGGPLWTYWTLNVANSPRFVTNATELLWSAAGAGGWAFGPNGGLAIVCWQMNPGQTAWIKQAVIAFAPLPNVTINAGQQLRFPAGSIRLYSD